MSGVLLASKLAYVFISLTDRLSTIQGVWWFCFHFSCWENWCFLCHSSISHTHMGQGGRGKWGTIAIFKDALENSREHFSTITSTVPCCWPLDTFKRKRLWLFFLKWYTHRQLFLRYYRCLFIFSTTWKGFVCIIDFSQPYTISSYSPAPCPPISILSRVLW